MDFAVRIPTSNRVASTSAIVDVAQAAEELGFSAVSAHDHLVFNGWWVACGARDAVGPGDDRDMYELITTLSFVAGKTSRIRLMTAILLLPLRHPVTVAKQIATLDALSQGRVVMAVGIGAGGAGGGSGSAMHLGSHAVNAAKEFETYHISGHRGHMANEYLEAMRLIWREPSASYEGRYVRFRDIEVFPKPAQPGGPPILIGGNSEAALRRVAAYGQGWLPSSADPDSYRSGVERIRRLAPERGRSTPATFGVNIFTTVAKTDEAALDIFEPTMGRIFDRAAIQRNNLVGSPDTVVAKLKEYQAAGLNLVEMKPIYRSVPELIDMLGLIAREVMPSV